MKKFLFLAVASCRIRYPKCLPRAGIQRINLGFFRK